MDWVTIKINEEELKTTLYNFENLEEINIDVSKEFFDRFDFPNQLYSGDYFGVLDRADKILHLCHRLNPKVFNKLHKGAVFYWMGIASFLIRNYQLAVYYMDAAASEDLKNDPYSMDTPARLFLRLEGDNPYQAAKNLTQDAESIIFSYVSMYNNLVCKSNSLFKAISMQRIRTQLLEKAANSTNPKFRSLATLLISFFLEFDFLSTQLLLRKEPGTNEPFFSHLFRGGLLFETLLKNNPSINTTKTTLNQILIDLDKDLGFPGELDFRGKMEFSNLIGQLEIDSDNIQDALHDTSIIRNVFGHNVAWNEQIEFRHYTKGFFSIALSCIHAISLLCT